MPTVTVPRDVRSQEVVEALRNGLDLRLPGAAQDADAPHAAARQAPAQRSREIMVAASPMVRAQVRIIPRAGQTGLRITPAGVPGDLVMNTLGIARDVRQALLDAPSLEVRKVP